MAYNRFFVSIIYEPLVDNTSFFERNITKIHNIYLIENIIQNEKKKINNNYRFSKKKEQNIVYLCKILYKLIVFFELYKYL